MKGAYCDEWNDRQLKSNIVKPNVEILVTSVEHNPTEMDI